ncbi:MAG: YkgJ family cysteine cluster protein [Pirellulales bacterium]
MTKRRGKKPAAKKTAPKQPTKKPTPPNDATAEFRLDLAFGESRRAVTLRATMAPLDQTDLLPILQQFDNEVVALAEEETARVGKTISCCAGCGACCRQLVPVAPAEARRLADLVASMDDERRAMIQRRFADALGAYERAGLVEEFSTAHRIPDEETRGEFGLAYFRVGVACPFLENESCGIYADRPLACREFLVTSPAENCRNPGPDNIERVKLPAQLSETLYRFSSSGERQPAEWMPLATALRYAEDHADSPLPRQAGGEFVQRFLAQLSGPSRA